MLFYKVISYIFHPVIFSIIATLLYFIILPSHITKQLEHSILIIVFLSTYLAPIVLLLFLKRFKMISNFHLHTIDERKFPILIMFVIFILLGMKFLETEVVNLLAYSFFGCALSLLLVYIGFFAKLKTSLHAISISGLIGFICVLSFEYKLNLLVLLVVLFFLFGIISISRLKLEAHDNNEIYFGFLIGFISQLAVYSYLSHNM